MTLENALDTALRADVTLGTYVSTRIYMIKAEQIITLPYLVFTIVADSDEQYAFGDTNTGMAKVQFDIVGNNRVDKIALYRIRTMFRGLSTISTLTVKHIFPSQIRERYDETTNRYVFSIDLDIIFAY